MARELNECDETSAPLAQTPLIKSTADGNADGEKSESKDYLLISFMK
jgi:hypothetical protein